MNNSFSFKTILEGYQPSQTRMAMDLYYYNGDCRTPEAQAQIKENFIEILNGSLYKEICTDPGIKDKCIAENVKVTCALVSSDGQRKKRSSGVCSSILCFKSFAIHLSIKHLDFGLF